MEVKTASESLKNEFNHFLDCIEKWETYWGFDTSDREVLDLKDWKRASYLWNEIQIGFDIVRQDLETVEVLKAVFRVYVWYDERSAQGGFYSMVSRLYAWENECFLSFLQRCLIKNEYIRDVLYFEGR